MQTPRKTRKISRKNVVAPMLILRTIILRLLFAKERKINMLTKKALNSRKPPMHQKQEEGK